MPKVSYVYRAQVLDVLDGDTLLILIDQGMHNQRREKLRLARVNAPEMSTPEGEPAKVYATRWVHGGAANALADGWPFIVATAKATGSPGIDNYGRYLCEIWRLDTGENLGDDLLRSGHAKIYGT
jgi:micrococcal nuclease